MNKLLILITLLFISLGSFAKSPNNEAFEDGVVGRNNTSAVPPMKFDVL